MTEATVSVPGLLLGAVALLVTAVPFSLLGLTVGYALPSRAALAVTQLLFFPMAFGGGLFFGGPDRMPSFLEHVAPFLPTRGAVELVWTATTDFSPRTDLSDRVGSLDCGHRGDSGVGLPAGPGAPFSVSPRRAAPDEYARRETTGATSPTSSVEARPRHRNAEDAPAPSLRPDADRQGPRPQGRGPRR